MTFLFSSIGINIFLDGFVPTENLRFRETSLVFKVAETAMEEEIKRMCRYEYPKMQKKMGVYFKYCRNMYFKTCQFRPDTLTDDYNNMLFTF